MDFKIKAYKHGSIKAQIDDDFQKVVDYFHSDFVKQFVNVNIIWDIETTNVPKQDVPSNLFTPNDGQCDAVMYLYDRFSFNSVSFGLTFNVSPTLRGIYLATDIPDDNVNYTYVSMAHEIIHAITYKICAEKSIILGNILDNPLVNGIVQPYYGNDQPYLVGGNYYQALQLIAPYMQTYKYFKPSEIVGLDPMLVSMLDKARGIAGVPFKITSGLRNALQNTSAGGVSDSTHLTGNAVDLACSDSRSRFIIEDALKQVGFIRFGIYLDHIHVDNSKTHDQKVMWIMDKE